MKQNNPMPSMIFVMLVVSAIMRLRSPSSVTRAAIKTYDRGLARRSHDVRLPLGPA